LGYWFAVHSATVESPIVCNVGIAAAGDSEALVTATAVVASSESGASPIAQLAANATEYVKAIVR
jgi:hypothetical protein